MPIDGARQQSRHGSLKVVFKVARSTLRLCGVTTFIMEGALLGLMASLTSIILAEHQ
jgi:hypothetical protein